MHDLRARQRAAVTDQTSERQALERNVAVQEATDATPKNETLHLRAEPQCIVCGETSRFSKWYPCWWGRPRR